MRRLLNFPFIASIRIYQWTLSSLWAGSCRFDPSCSHYALTAIERHGLLKGCGLTLRRISKCHPFGSAGYDPVPEKK